MTSLVLIPGYMLDDALWDSMLPFLPPELPLHFARLAEGDSIAAMEHRVRTTVFRFASAKDNVDFFRTYYGPTLKTFEAISSPERDALEREMIELNYKYDLNGGRAGPIAIEAEYLESVMVRA